jgi:hypothetical protein
MEHDDLHDGTSTGRQSRLGTKSQEIPIRLGIAGAKRICRRESTRVLQRLKCGPCTLCHGNRRDGILLVHFLWQMRTPRNGDTAATVRCCCARVQLAGASGERCASLFPMIKSFS